jgi:hypothetical protein
MNENPSLPLQSPCDKDHQQGKGKAQPDHDAIAKALMQRNGEMSNTSHGCQSSEAQKKLNDR